MTPATRLPDDDTLGFFFGAYIDMLRKAGSYHWFSHTGSVEQVRDYVWSLMDLHPSDLEHDEISSSNGALEFLGVATPLGSVITCLWKNDVGSEAIVRAVNREWDSMRAALENGTFTGLPWAIRSTLMMFGEIDPREGLTELYDFLQDGKLVPLAAQH